MLPLEMEEQKDTKIASVTVIHPEAAALAVVKIFALSNPQLSERYQAFQRQNKEFIIEADRELSV